MNLETATTELRAREPIFHQEELCNTQEKLEAYVAPDFFEISASGKYYTREYVIGVVLDRFTNNTEPDTSEWFVEEFQCTQLGLMYFLRGIS